MKRPFNKPVTTYEQQLAQLQARGLLIADPVVVAHYLQHINYYRLSAYWLPLEADHAPIWAVCEVMSLGLLSRWYANLKSGAARRAVASVYGLDERVLESWLHHLTFIRNTCAHHSRLWNRDFTITAELPRSKPAHLAGEFVSGSRKLYNTLVMLLHLMDVIAPAHHWRQRLNHLIHHHAINTAAMGFPAGWETRTIWQETTP